MNTIVIVATIFVGSLEGRLNYGVPTNSDVIAAREGYVIGFNNITHCPDWTMYRLTVTNLIAEKVGRSNDFRHDAQVPRSAELSDYKASGWARGHMVPAADMKWSAKAMSETFLLSNIIPQDTRNNSGAWNRIEQQVRNWAKREVSLFVITGPIYDTEQPSRYIGSTGVRVPNFIYKVILDETPPRKMIAFIAPNKDTKKRPWQMVVTVDEVEEATGFDFFRMLPKDEQENLEASSNYDNWQIYDKCSPL